MVKKIVVSEEQLRRMQDTGLDDAKKRLSTSNLKDKAIAARDRVKDKALSTRDAVLRKREDARSKVRKKPLRSVMVAGAIGAAVGATGVAIGAAMRRKKKSGKDDEEYVLVVEKDNLR